MSDLDANIDEAMRLVIRLRHTLFTTSDTARTSYLLQLAAAVLSECARGQRPLIDADDTAADLPADLRNVAQLLAKADRDSDAVSVFALGSSWADTDRAIMVFKGPQAIAYVHQLLVRQGLVTEGKPVCDDDAPADAPQQP